MLKIVGLISARLKGAVVEAKRVMLFPGICFNSVGDAAADLVRIAQGVEGLVVRRLKVVVNEAALFLLSHGKVCALELRL